MNAPIIIFDFNRTLYDPESKRLIDGARESLRLLRQQGYALYLVSRGSEERYRLIGKLGLLGFFDGISVTEQKNLEAFEAISLANPIASLYVVGDRPSQEIRFGNQIGATTIRFQQGKFASERAQSNEERADHTIRNLSELLTLLR
jgi:FMN phosphatase YigB (HAD superfamily)